MGTIKKVMKNKLVDHVLDALFPKNQIKLEKDEEFDHADHDPNITRTI